MSDSTETGTTTTPSKARLRALTGIVPAIVIFLIAAALIFVAFFQATGVDNEAALVSEDDYQAVFLTNGQVYFGKLTEVDSTFYQLSDIFYLQVQQQVQPNGTEGTDPTTATTTPASGDAQTQLVKLGEELHGPQDAMQINRSQVQFWENLKSNGKVAEAIENYQR